MIQTTPLCKPQLDPDFIPAALWNREYLKAATGASNRRKVRIAVDRPEGTTWIYETTLLPESAEAAADTFKYCERTVKFLLWAWGGSKVRISNAPDVVAQLKAVYSADGKRAFDYDFMGTTCFDQDFSIENASDAEIQEVLPAATGGMGSLKGNRLGFDLGGSDRKCAAMIDGKVVFSEEIKWSPYFESDPAYHRAGIEDSLKRAAAHLPTVDAIGGSAAGIYINNEPRVGSLYRGISPDDFQKSIRNLFHELKSEWKDIPFALANDGDVTAMAGAMAINDNAVLGISMGTSLAAGYIDTSGYVTGWINELAFVPVDYREGVATDEWSGDDGCGVQYFSQQGVGRLLPLSGIKVSEGLGLPEKLEAVQEKMAQGDERAAAIYRTIGTYFGYTIAHFAEFYEFRHLLILGRVSSGKGGDLVMEEARRVLDLEFPELSKTIAFQTPDEKTKRHGQAIAAATLPKLD
ncbi:MAG: putative NBD/HSP70 family sugar kinase [Lentimonas sp.]|jgi:predicted NBD/HSP70 family sugar kinase